MCQGTCVGMTGFRSALHCTPAKLKKGRDCGYNLLHESGTKKVTNIFTEIESTFGPLLRFSLKVALLVVVPDELAQEGDGGNHY